MDDPTLEEIVWCAAPNAAHVKYDQESVQDARVGLRSRGKCGRGVPRNVSGQVVMRADDPRMGPVANGAACMAMRRMRREVDLSGRQMARLMNSHHPIIYRIESGRHGSSLTTIVRWARACNRRPGEIMIAVDRAIGLIR